MLKKNVIRTGSVLGVYTGIENSAASRAVRKLHCYIDGVSKDRHRGLTRFTMERDIDFIKKDQEVLNLRQVTLVSKEESDLIAKNLGVDSVKAEDLSANIHIDGCDDLSKLPVGSIVAFSRGCYLMLTGDNFPCIVAGTQVQSGLPDTQGVDKNFVKASIHRRGQTAIVYKAGVVKAGDTYEIIIPRHVTVGLEYVKTGNV